MEQQVESQEQVIKIVVKGPKGEVVSLSVSSYDSVVSIKERLFSYYSFAPYTCYHFEVDVKPGRMVVDEIGEFGTFDFIKDGSTFFVVCDQYNTLAVREHIKYTVASVSGNLPLIGLLLKKQDDELPESLVSFQNLIANAEKDQDISLDGKLKEYHMDKEAITRDQALKSEIVKPTFPVTFNLESFNQTESLLTKSTETPVTSLIMSAYNPPSKSRQLVGDLLYIRLITKEKSIHYITCSTTGFYINQSTDSVFNPSLSIEYPSTHLTLIHLFNTISPLFSAWYTKRVNEGDQTNQIQLEDILNTLRALPSSNTHAGSWFGNSHSNDDVHDLFSHAETILDDQELSHLRADVNSHREWLGEYVSAVEMAREEPLNLFLAIAKENEFAEAAKRAVVKIVDDSVSPIVSTIQKDVYIVNDITFTPVQTSRDGSPGRTMANYEVISGSQISSAHIPNLFTPLVAVIDYKGQRFLAQTPVPGITDRPVESLLLSGSVDKCATLFNDDRVQPQLKALAEKLHWDTSLLCQTRQNLEEQKETESTISAPAISKPISLKQGETAEFLGPAEGCLVRGVDGNVYGIDFVRSQPVDAYWIQELIRKDEQAYGMQAMLRPELVEQLLGHRNEMKERVEMVREVIEKKEKGETVEGLTEERFVEMKKEMELLEKTLSTIPEKFDVNVFTPYSATTVAAQNDPSANTTHEGNALLLSNFLVSQMVPTVLEQLRSLPLNNQDGSKLVQLLHSSGVNVRYLGLLASLCINGTLNETNPTDLLILRACENEMVSRAIKHIINHLLSDQYLSVAPSYTVIAVLNSLFQKSTDSALPLLQRKSKKNKSTSSSSSSIPVAIIHALVENSISGVGVWKRITELINKKYHYTLRLLIDQSSESHLSIQSDRVVLLRRVCNMIGVKLQAIPYDLTSHCVFQPENIESFSPRVKHVRTSFLDDMLMNLFRNATQSLQQGELSTAFFYCRQVVITAVSACHCIHPLITRALATISSILFAIRDYLTAVKYARLSLSCSQRVFGVDSIEVAICHSQLSAALGRAGGLHESILHYKLSLDIYLMACGNRSEEIGEVYSNLGTLYQELVFNDKAIACYIQAMKLLSKTHVQYESVVKGLAACYALTGSWSSAVKYEQMVVELLKTKEQKDEKAIADSEKKVKEYNSKMMMQMSMKSILG